MPQFSARWLEIAIDQYLAFGPETREQIDARIQELLDQPIGRPSAYDEPSDQWTTTYGEGAGLILYAVAEEFRRVLILRLL